MSEIEQCRLCCTKGNDQINLQRETSFSQYVVETIGQHIKELEKDQLPKFVCLACWRKLELFHLFSEAVKLAQTKFLDELKYANPFPDAFNDIMCIEDEKKIEIDETLAIDDTQTETIEPTVQPASTASNRQQSIDDDSSDSSDNDDDDDNMDEKSLEKSMGIPAPWFSGLSESLRNGMVRKFFDMSCELCPNVIFQSDTEARSHYLKHHQKMGYIRCCGKRYFDKINVYNHIEYHKHPENFKCKECSLQFKTKMGLFRHVKHHTVRKLAEKQRTFVCHICDRDFIHENMLRIHLRRLHNEGVDEQQDETAASHKFICEHCGQSFIALISLEKHIQSKHMEQVRVKCKICNASLSQFSLYAHMQNIHSSKPQKCPHCEKISPNKAALTNHLREVHKKCDLKCAFCEKTFKTTRSLRGHEATHTGLKEHKCRFCKREFTHKSSMYCHQKRVHPEEWAQAKLSNPDMGD